MCHSPVLLCCSVAAASSYLGLWVDTIASLTLTAAPVGRKLVPGLTGTSVAAQRVDAALVTLAVVWTGAFVHLWQDFKKK